MIALRDYQIDAIERVRLAMVQGARRVVLVVPTGGGKTVIASEVVRRVVASGRRALWIVHRSELVDQAADTLTAIGLTVGGKCATAQTPPNPYAPVQVASIQTLLARGERPPADMIVVDEAHHMAEAAESFSTLLTHYGSTLTLGLTATPERGDGCGLGSIWNAIVVGTTVRELVDLGHLVPCEVLRPDRPLEPGEVAQHPVDAYVEHAPGRRAIVFVRSVPLADQYAQEFSLRGVTARGVSNETPWAERRLYVDAFRRGTIDVLVNVAVLTEGFDAPECSCVILARGCGSAGLYLQMVGRALRPAPGKSDAMVLDLRGVSHEHGRPDDPREYSLDGAGIRLRDPASYCLVCGAPRTPPDACDSCGYVATGEDLAKPDRVTGDPLVKYAKKRAEDDTKRAETLARWICDGRARGFKPGWAYAKYAAVYGGRPSGDVIAAARALLAERGAA